MTFRPARLVFSLLVLAAAGGGYWFWRQGLKPSTIEFNTALIERGNLEQTVTATGDLQPVETVEVSSQISGLIKQVLVDYNTQVKAGDVLAVLDTATYQTRLRQAEAELANTAANHQLMRVNAERIGALHERKLVSQQELDQAMAQLAQAEAQLLIRTAAVETARVDLARCTITAPIDGLVLDRPAIAGKTVSASTTAPVLFVLVNDLRQLQIKAAIAEADIGQVKEGQMVAFTVDAFPNRAFKGVVRQIRNQAVVQSNVVTYATLIDVANDRLDLKPGMTANVSVTVQERAGILLMPNSALRVRIAEEFKLPAEAVAAGAVSAESGAGGGEGDPLRKLLAEVGYKETAGGRPTREQMVKVRALAAERGIVLPELRRGGRGGSPATEAETRRTVYVPVETPAGMRARAVEVRLGITDGINTQIIAGLEEKVNVVTSVREAEAATAVTGGASNPFAPNMNRPRRF